VSISSPWSQANCAFVKERSSLTVEGVCAPSVAPKKQGDTSFLSMGGRGGGEAGGVGPVDGLLKVKHPLKIPFTSAASRLPLFGVFFFVAGRSPTRYDGRNPAGWMASSSRMRLGRRPKDDDPHKECALTGSETGAYRSGVGHRSARFRAYRPPLCFLHLQPIFLARCTSTDPYPISMQSRTRIVCLLCCSQKLDPQHPLQHH